MHKLEQNSGDRRLDIRGRGILQLVRKETERERENCRQITRRVEKSQGSTGDDICFFKLKSEKKNNGSLLSCTFSIQCVSVKEALIDYLAIVCSE